VWTLAAAAGAASLTVMLSGYATGSALGVPLAGGLAGLGLAGLMIRDRAPSEAAVGVGVVGLFGLLLIASFFATLTWVNASLLFAAPLLSWLPRAPFVRRSPAWVRGPISVALATGLLAFVVWRAFDKFNADAEAERASGQGSAEDYSNFRP
jgi:hypothetical protein